MAGYCLCSVFFFFALSIAHKYNTKFDILKNFNKKRLTSTPCVLLVGFRIQCCCNIQGLAITGPSCLIEFTQCNVSQAEESDIGFIPGTSI